MIRAGKLDQIIEIQSVTNTIDGTGDSTEVWARVAGSPTRAEYISLTGLEQNAERMNAGKLESITKFKLRIRRFSTMSTTYKITHNSDTYKITGIVDGHRNNEMILYCAEVV